MPPQTRSTTKSSRTTRNSTYGRPSLTSPPRPRKTAVKRPESALAHDPQAEGDATPVVGNLAGEKGPWYACQDLDGSRTSVAISQTGKGIHVRWQYARHANGDAALTEVDEMEAEEVEKIVDENHDIVPTTPPATAAGPRNVAHSPFKIFPETPMALDPYEPGSVTLTPVKRARPLQPSPPRIGDTRGIRCLYEQDSVLRELKRDARIILRHVVGSSVNMSRDQLEVIERKRENTITHTQLVKLLADDRRVREEENIYCSESSDSDIDCDDTGSEMVVSSADTDHELVCFRGSHGGLLDQHARPRFGPDGTLPADSITALRRGIMREDAFLTESPNHHTTGANGSCRPRLGPCGTELIDY